MAEGATAETLTAKSPQTAPPWLGRWPLLVGFAILLAPTLSALGKQVWTRESGAHGPIILATGAWLLWREAGSLKAAARPGSPWITGAAAVLTLTGYALGRAADFISVETAGIYAFGLTVIYAEVGLRAMLRHWFPMFYLSFCIPPPVWLIDEITAPLKQFVSSIATTVLSAAGLPIGREGVTIHVAQYQLLVEDACSGMNSLIGLFAISLLYIYLLRGSSLRYSLVLTLFVPPIAILGNILRIMTLILLTYFFGDQVAQGFAHFAAGIFLFGVDLLLVFLVDNVLCKVLPRAWRPA
jgi:exosortase